MTYARTDRRRGLMQEYAPITLAPDWHAPEFIRAKSIRSMALSGLQNLNLYNLEITKPLGIVELLGSRTGIVSTVMLVVFSCESESQEKMPSFHCDGEYAVGTLSFPVSMFSGILQLVSSPNVYFRIGYGADCNRISTDALFAA